MILRAERKDRKIETYKRENGWRSVSSANLFLILVLLRIQLYDQLFVYFLRYLVALRVGKKFTLHSIGVPFEPSELPYVICFGAGVDGDNFHTFRLATNGNYIAGFQRVRRDIHDLAVYRNVRVTDQLAGAATGWGDAKTVNRVVQTRFQQLQQYFAGNTVATCCAVEGFAELAFQHTVCILRFLLFRQLLRVVRDLLLLTRLAMLARRVFAALKVLVVSEDRIAKGACFLGCWSCITSHIIGMYAIKNAVDKSGNNPGFSEPAIVMT